MSYWLSRMLGILPRDAQTRKAIRAKFNHPESDADLDCESETDMPCRETHLSEHTSLVTEVGQAASTATVTAGILLQKLS